MLSWLRTLFRPAPEPPPSGGSGSEVRVAYDEDAITVSQSLGREIIAWSELAKVLVHTTDGGPFEADLFWVLEATDGRTLTIPMGSSGETDLLKAMQRRLQHFDNMAVVEAMGSTEMARFVVWEAGS